MEPFLSHIHSCTVVEKAMLKVHEGELEGIPVAAVYSGVCKVNAAIAAQVLIDCFQVEAVINAGTAGGMEESLQIFDTVVSTQALYHDVEEHILTEFHPWMQTAWFPADQELLEAAKKGCLTRAQCVFWQDGYWRTIYYGRTPFRNQSEICAAVGRYGNGKYRTCMLCKPNSVFIGAHTYRYGSTFRN